jgi:hypothetical protein
MSMSKNQWWGYRNHQSGTIQVKRYWDDRASIEDAYESDFVAEVVEPFVAGTRDEALKIAAERLRHRRDKRPLVDPKVFELAEHFLSDLGGEVSKDQKWQLAKVIQDAVEGWFEHG